MQNGIRPIAITISIHNNGITIFWPFQCSFDITTISLMKSQKFHARKTLRLWQNERRKWQRKSKCIKLVREAHSKQRTADSHPAIWLAYMRRSRIEQIQFMTRDLHLIPISISYDWFMTSIGQPISIYQFHLTHMRSFVQSKQKHSW